jgi:hypothetical protein
MGESMIRPVGPSGKHNTGIGKMAAMATTTTTTKARLSSQQQLRQLQLAPAPLRTSQQETSRVVLVQAQAQLQPALPAQQSDPYVELPHIDSECVRMLSRRRPNALPWLTLIPLASIAVNKDTRTRTLKNRVGRPPPYRRGHNRRTSRAHSRRNRPSTPTCSLVRSSLYEWKVGHIDFPLDLVLCFVGLG